MKLFPYAHATHPQWRMAAALVLAQLRARMALPDHAASPSLGLLYITDRYADQAQAILEHLCAELPEVTDWVGTVGVGIASNNVEYFDEPAMAVMLCDLDPARYRVFSGVAPLSVSGRSGDGEGFLAHTALVHADGQTPDLTDLISEVAERTASGYLFGGLASSRGATVQFALGSSGNLRGQGASAGVFHGGLSGVAFAAEVGMLSRVTQGAQPVGAERTITAAEGNLVLTLDGQPALDILLQERGISLEQPAEAMPRLRATLAGLRHGLPSESSAGSAPLRRGQFGADVTVRHLIGVDPQRRGVAIGDHAPVGSRLAFCERHTAAARADLTRICAELREELEPEARDHALAHALSDNEAESAPHPARRIAGAVYVSCAGRGGPHFGSPSAELQVVRRALGDVPLVGFFAGGEIAYHRLYGYTGVLTVFTTPVA